MAMDTDKDFKAAEDSTADEAEFQLLELSLEEVIDFLNERDVPASCERCGNNNWMVTTQVEGREPAIVAKKGSAPFADSFSLPAFLTICNNCGNVRTFARFPIDLWKKTRLKASS